LKQALSAPVPAPAPVAAPVAPPAAAAAAPAAAPQVKLSNKACGCAKSSCSGRCGCKDNGFGCSPSCACGGVGTCVNSYSYIAGDPKLAQAQARIQERARITLEAKLERQRAALEARIEGGML